MSAQKEEEDMEEEETQLVLDRNPLEWSVDEVVQFINSTDCASLANIFQEQVTKKSSKSRHNWVVTTKAD